MKVLYRLELHLVYELCYAKNVYKIAHSSHSTSKYPVLKSKFSIRAKVSPKAFSFNKHSAFVESSEYYSRLHYCSNSWTCLCSTEYIISDIKLWPLNDALLSRIWGFIFVLYPLTRFGHDRPQLELLFVISLLMKRSFVLMVLILFA